MTVRFDSAWSAARELAMEVAGDGYDVVVVRDLLGRVCLVVDDANPVQTGDHKEWERRLRSRCAPFIAETPVLLTSGMFTAETITASADLYITERRSGAHGRVALLDRGLVGKEWRTVSTSPRPQTVALYGFKGGVGRSTATVVLAQGLAQAGKCVLIVDLDLESPGISSAALRPADLPDFGMVDVLVESALQNQDGLMCVAASSYIQGTGNGEVWVAPAGGRPRDGYTYLPKLNRAYLETGQDSGPYGQTDGFASRLERAVDYCVLQVERLSRRPDVVLLDSRAGIHDLAAVAITKLADLALLFATDNPQTWSGYRELFQQWSGSELGRAIRDRLQIVATMVPAARESGYLDSLRDKAQLLFSESLYDNADADDPDAYNPSVDDISAPHFAIPILFTVDLVGLNPDDPSWLKQEFVAAAFNRFVISVSELIMTEEDQG